MSCKTCCRNCKNCTRKCKSKKYGYCDDIEDLRHMVVLDKLRNCKFFRKKGKR